MRCGLSGAELTSACEMLASETFLCVIYSMLLHFFDEYVVSSKFFAIDLIPQGGFSAWAASKAAQLDFAWSRTELAEQVFDWSSQQNIQERLAYLEVCVPGNFRSRFVRYAFAPS